ncbi:MAG: tetratricopeptide repeat protein [Longimicrobiales bacterium]
MHWWTALELDPTLGEVHTALGIVRLFRDWDWAGAERSLRRAVALNAGDAHAYHHLANYFNVMAMLDDAIAARSRSLELDPLNPRTVTVLAGDYVRLGDPEAVEEYARLATLRGATPREVDALRDAFARGGMPAFWRAWTDMDRRQLPDQNPVRMTMLWLAAGDTAQAMEWLDRAFEERNPGLVMLGRGQASSLDGMQDHPRVARIIAAMKLPRG